MLFNKSLLYLFAVALQMYTVMSMVITPVHDSGSGSAPSSPTADEKAMAAKLQTYTDNLLSKAKADKTIEKAVQRELDRLADKNVKVGLEIAKAAPAGGAGRSFKGVELAALVDKDVYANAKTAKEKWEVVLGAFRAAIKKAKGPHQAGFQELGKVSAAQPQSPVLPDSPTLGRREEALKELLRRRSLRRRAMLARRNM